MAAVNPERTALRALRDQIVELWGDPENCEDCGDIGDRPCQIHESPKLYTAMLAAEEALGPCRCGHARSEHHTEESAACLGCGCEGFWLPAIQDVVDAG